MEYLPFLDFFEADLPELFPDFFFVEREDEDLPFFLEAADESEKGISIVNANIQMSQTFLLFLNIYSLNYQISMQGGNW